MKRTNVGRKRNVVKGKVNKNTVTISDAQLITLVKILSVFTTIFPENVEASSLRSWAERELLSR